MFSFIIAFLAGDLYLQTRPQLVTTTFVILLLISTLIILLSWYRYSKQYSFLRSAFCLMLLQLFLGFVCGFAWGNWYAHNVLSWTLDQSLEGKTVLAQGRIASLPKTDFLGSHFEFYLEHLFDGKNTSHPKAYVQLTWRSPQENIIVGEQYQLHLRLKRIHSLQSPGAFDFEAWALQKKLRATAYVMIKEKNTRIDQAGYHFLIHQLRQTLQNKILQFLPQTKTAPWLMALILGERQGIPASDWYVLRQTGTNHLMAIAGLHIGMMATFGGLLIAWIWRCFPYCVLLMPAKEAAGLASLMIGAAYSALAGFSLPTERALIMLSLYIFTLLTRQKISIWTIWSLALGIVLLLNPLNVLTESFWLSFGTIALIIFGMHGRLAPSGFWWKWGRVQWVVGVGLMPLSLGLFQQCSLISFVANSIAIPWLGFLILPFCLVGSLFLWIFPALACLCLNIADKSLSGLWQFLSYLAHIKFAIWQHTIPNTSLFILAIVAYLFLLLPVGLPGRCLSVIWLGPLLLFEFPCPDSEAIWLSILDVGQGLSVVVQTKTHTLIYDAGPKFQDHFDAGEHIVIPYLQKNNIKKIDRLVISHGDNDHIGGASALIQSIPVKTISSSVPEKLLALNYPIKQLSTCLQGQRWQWDGVDFEFLYPTQDRLHLGNDSSCVLKIGNGKQSILLTGDIEKKAELQMLATQSAKLQATILIAPHHGSKTSGNKAFIAAVHANYVIYATGYRNRYHFPHPSVMTAYKKRQTLSFNTAETGTIQFKIDKEKGIDHIDLYRLTHQRYWF